MQCMKYELSLFTGGGTRKLRSNAERDLIENLPFQPGGWGTDA